MYHAHAFEVLDGLECMTVHYRDMSPRRSTYVTGNLTYVIGKGYKSSIVIHLHCSLIDVGRLRRTHMLVVVVHTSVDIFRLCVDGFGYKFYFQCLSSILIPFLIEQPDLQPDLHLQNSSIYQVALWWRLQLGAYLVLIGGLGANEAYGPLSTFEPYMPFRDPTCGNSTYQLPVFDCIKVHLLKDFVWFL
jgi:hypothetical protein